MTAVFLLWSGRDLLMGFATSPEGKARVLRESVAAFFHLEQPDSMPVIGAKPRGREIRRLLYRPTMRWCRLLIFR